MPDITSTTGKSARDQLRDLAEAAKEFSGYGPGFDMIMNGIELVAADMAAEEKWQGDDLAARYLEPDFPMSFQRVPPVPAQFTAF